MEQTFVLVKPDAVQRGLIGEIISRLENRGLKLIASQLVQVSKELAEKHYEVHFGKPFYVGLIEYITSAPVLAMVWEGPGAIVAVRQTMGATNPLDATPGSVRHDLALTIGRNLTHASDSLKTAKFEIDLWFQHDEILDWGRTTDTWIYDE